MRCLDKLGGLIVKCLSGSLEVAFLCLLLGDDMVNNAFEDFEDTDNNY